MIDFLGEELRHLSRGTFGAWTRSVRDRWTRVAKRIPVPPGTKDAILSVGLMGATGILDIDGLTLDLVARGGKTTTNLIVNGGFELGDPGPTSWVTDNDAHRAFPGNGSPAALELSRARSHAMTGVALPVGQFQWLDVTVAVRCSGLRGAGGAAAAFFFVNDLGKPLPGPAGANLFHRMVR